MAVPTLVGSRVRLRSARDSDAADRLANGTHAEIIRMYGGDTAMLPRLTAELARAWLDGIRAHPLAWVIEHEGRCVGQARLDALDADHAHAQYAVGLHVPSLLGQGLGKEATRLVLAHAFGTLGLHRVGLRVLAFNERAVRCYEACGFRIEGRERESARVDGRWHDDLIMGVLAGELGT